MSSTCSYLAVQRLNFITRSSVPLPHLSKKDFSCFKQSPLSSCVRSALEAFSLIRQLLANCAFLPSNTIETVWNCTGTSQIGLRERWWSESGALVREWSLVPFEAYQLAAILLQSMRISQVYTSSLINNYCAMEEMWQRKLCCNPVAHMKVSSISQVTCLQNQSLCQPVQVCADGAIRYYALSTLHQSTCTDVVLTNRFMWVWFTLIQIIS